MYHQSEVERILIGKILEVTGQAIEGSDRIWKYFPAYRYAEPPIVTSFCEFVCEHFEVILSERDWQNPTVSSLAAKIVRKREKPDDMYRAFEKETRQFRKGLIVTLAFFGLLSLTPVLAHGESAFLVSLGFAVTFTLGVSATWVRENRRRSSGMRLYLKYRSNHPV